MVLTGQAHDAVGQEGAQPAPGQRNHHRGAQDERLQHVQAADGAGNDLANLLHILRGRIAPIHGGFQGTLPRRACGPRVLPPG